MMSSATCTNCGAVLVSGAKFCRQCGRIVPTANAQSVTEATTRTLRTPADYGAQPTDIFSAQPTSPAYMAPGQMPQPPAYTTSHLEQRGRKGNAWLISLLAVLFVVSLVASLFALGVIKINSSRTAPQPPSIPVAQPPTTTVPDGPPPPPQPPATTSGSNSISRAFIYPGAETMMDMTRAGAGSLLQLRTQDSYQKVLDWYIAKLKPENIIRSPGPNAVLKSEKLMAVINSTGEGTMIMLKEIDEMDMDIDK
jgi:hypothetical protein